MKIMKLCAVLAAGVLVAGGCGSSFRQSAIEGTGPRVTEEGILFSFFSTKATGVCIAGDFNNWSMTSDPLQDREGTGTWTILLPLKPGRHEYKFVVDSDKWIRDPGNPETVDDGFGGVNSILVVE